MTRLSYWTLCNRQLCASNCLLLDPIYYQLDIDSTCTWERSNDAMYDLTYSPFSSLRLKFSRNSFPVKVASWHRSFLRWYPLSLIGIGMSAWCFFYKQSMPYILFMLLAGIPSVSNISRSLWTKPSRVHLVKNNPDKYATSLAKAPYPDHASSVSTTTAKTREIN